MIWILAFDPFGFTGGHGALDVGGEAPPAEACGRCHPQELTEWSGSRHRQAWTNDRMQHAYVFETQQFCVSCHAPLPEQAAEIEANAAWYAAQDPRNPVVATPFRRPEPRAAEGITCATCHWRGGSVLAPQASGGAPHPLRATPELRTASFCEGCHDFEVPHTSLLMQSTTAEWRQWRDDGGTATCQSCHMPHGSHRFRGANDVELLRRSIRATQKRRGGVRSLTLSTRGVGHAVPTGDIFRQLVVEVHRERTWQEVERFGRALQHDVDPWTGEPTTTLARDERLWPGHPVTVEIPDGAPWRIRYLYISEPALMKAQPADQVSVVLTCRGTDSETCAEQVLPHEIPAKLVR